MATEYTHGYIHGYIILTTIPQLSSGGPQQVDLSDHEQDHGIEIQQYKTTS